MSDEDDGIPIEQALYEDDEPGETPDEKAPAPPGTPYQAGDRRQVKKKEKEADRRQRDLALTVAAILETRQGRQLMAYLIYEVLGLYTTSANAAFDPGAVHFREGARQGALILRKLCTTANRADYLRMVEENLEQS